MEQQKKKKGAPGWLKFTVGVVVIVIIVNALGSDKDKGAASRTPSSTINAVSTGQPLQTSYFLVTASKPMLVSKLVINDFETLPKEEGNQYLMFDLTAKNTDNESRMMTEGELLIQSGGKMLKYEQSETIMTEGYGAFLDNLNPGVTKHTKLVFKIPAGLSGTVYYHPGRSDDDKLIRLITIG